MRQKYDFDTSTSNACLPAPVLTIFFWKFRNGMPLPSMLSQLFSDFRPQLPLWRFTAHGDKRVQITIAFLVRKGCRHGEHMPPGQELTKKQAIAILPRPR